MITTNEIFRLITIVMPVRIDSDDRKANLQAVLRHVSEQGYRVIVLEADSESKLKDETWMMAAEHIFVCDNNPNFHRTRYINELLEKAKTDIVAVWDADVLIDDAQILNAIRLIQSGYTMVYPYNGEYVMLSKQDSNIARKHFDNEELKSRNLNPIFRRPFCGGIFLVHRRRYMECGGENEHFTGWGPEDAERLRRVKILGQKVGRIDEGQAYHLDHVRGNNSNFFTHEDAVKLRNELVKVCSMDKKELQMYISDPTWKKK